MQTIWQKLVAELEAGRRVFLALVIESTRGSPGTPSSALLVTGEGEQSGTIGGGCMEQNVYQQALDALRKGRYATRISRLEHRNTGKDDASGLICGGSQTNLLALVDPSLLVIARTVVEYFHDDRAGVLTISEEAWTFEPGQQSSRSLWLEASNPWRLHLSTHNRKRVAIFGGGHCGAALARQMRRLGFAVVVIEPRTNLFTLDDIERVTVLTTDRFAAGAALVNYPEMTLVVVLTPSARQDVDALSGILKHPFPFIGVMGSRAKIDMIRKSIRDRGFENEDWQRITAPVGFPIDSDTPEEIAVSVSAQILDESRKLGLR
jgi:xanthine dehydrogenase accessory factor